MNTEQVVPSDDLAEAFVAVVELCQALGVSAINRFPGCWTHQIDERWWIAVNGHGTPKTAEAPSGLASHVPATVPPYLAYVEYNGWPFAIFGPTGGTIGAGDLANEDAFIAAVRAATADASTAGGAGGS